MIRARVIWKYSGEEIRVFKNLKRLVELVNMPFVEAFEILDIEGEC
jgi:hypothetical protein